MRTVAATAMAVGAAAVLLCVSGADRAPQPESVAEHTPGRTSGAELISQAAVGIADLKPPAPPTAGAPAPVLRHVPAAPQPEAVKLPTGPLGIPGAAYAAYQSAADRMAIEAPGCGIEWNLVAAIGRIESGHADGGNVDAAGNTLTPIEGPVLDGSLPGNAVIRDGAGFARALGPMQFLSTTWALFGADGNGDGKSDVHNLRDAAYGAARYLCSSGSGLASESGQRTAVFAYNQSNAYVDNVVAWSKAYRDRAIPVGGIPDMAAPVAPPTKLPKPLPPAKIDLAACGAPTSTAARASGPQTPKATTSSSSAVSSRPAPAETSSTTSSAVPVPGGALAIPSQGGAAPTPPATAASSATCPSAPSDSARPTSPRPPAPSAPGAPDPRSVAPKPGASNVTPSARPGAPNASGTPAPSAPRAAPDQRVRPSVPTTTTAPR